MPEDDACGMLLDAMNYLSGTGCPWLQRSAIMEQVTADVVEQFDAAVGALLSLRAIRVAHDGQLRLEAAAGF